MKRKLLMSLGLLVVLGVVLAGSAKAMNAQSADDVVIPKGKIIDASSYLAGSSILVEGDIKGDLYCAGQNISIRGTVEGDVLCAGQTVTIAGTVRGDVRAAGQVVMLQGIVGGSVTMFGQKTNVESSAKVGRDVTAFGQNVYVAGNVGRDVVAGGETTVSAAQIGRNATMFGENVSVTSGNIGGDFTYTSNQSATINSDADIAGKTERKEPPQRAQETMPLGPVAGASYWFLAMSAIGIVLLLLAPKLLKRTDHTLQAHTLLALGTGALGLLVLPMIVVLLMVTIIGLPLGLLLLMLWIVALATSLVITGYTIGMLLTKQQKTWNSNRWQQALSLIAGLFVLMVISLIPVVGGIALFLAVLWGSGSLLLSVFQAQSLRKKAV